MARVTGSLAFVLALMGVACAGEPLSVFHSPAIQQEVSLSGWFHIIWNDRARYVLINDQGRSVELLLDEDLARPFGGPRAFNRKRVKIVGERVSMPPGAVRVLAIEFE